MRSSHYDFQFLYGILQENRPTMAVGGIVAIVAGFLLGKMSMVLVGSFVLLVVSLEYVITLLFGDRNSN